mmetsp:Transcript_54229/g.118650  ORF Transcript_54229/g.118650 Transcript_54229/m.118650 type:complete len:103 (+) Transcript_54229:282-590(+)
MRPFVFSKIGQLSEFNKPHRMPAKARYNGPRSPLDILKICKFSRKIISEASQFFEISPGKMGNFQSSGEDAVVDAVEAAEAWARFSSSICRCSSSIFFWLAS